jgi:predicted CXXCH cytochrome family protein
MKTRALVAAACFAALALAASDAAAGSCTSSGCHKKITGAKFLHGPVAAEETGGEGCVSCHVPAGQACTAAKAGKYTYKTKKERLCLLCHERGTATQHTRTRTDCLSCHNPHQSEQSKNLLRAGQGAETKAK